MSQQTLFFGAAVLVLGLFGLLFITQGDVLFGGRGTLTATSTPTSTSSVGATSTAPTSTPIGGASPEPGELTVSGRVTATYQSAKAVVIDRAGTMYNLAQGTGTKYFDEGGRPATIDYIRPGFTVWALGTPTKSDTMIPREVRVLTAPNILLYAPKANATIGLPVVLTGEARVFESEFRYRITDQAGKVLGVGSIMVKDPETGRFGPFEARISYDPSQTATGFVEVFENSAENGAEINKVRIPVTFSATSTAQVKAYFSSRTFDPETERCGTVYPVVRTVAKTATPARAALEALLMGPSPTESGAGYFTSINSGVKVNSLTIVNGVARADFNEELERAVGGSCRVTAIRAQIEETLRQFPSVRSVVISVNGRSDDVLQP